MIPTTSLEMSKRLKDGGFRQDSEVYHTYGGASVPTWEVRSHAWLEWAKDTMSVIEWYASLTTDEILEELPFKINYHYRLEIYKGDNKFGVAYYNAPIRDGVIEFQNESLPEALGEMWLWLKQEGLL